MSNELVFLLHPLTLRTTLTNLPHQQHPPHPHFPQPPLAGPHTSLGHWRYRLLQVTLVALEGRISGHGPLRLTVLREVIYRP